MVKGSNGNVFDKDMHGNQGIYSILIDGGEPLESQELMVLKSQR